MEALFYWISTWAAAGDDPASLRQAAELAHAHALSFHDAAWTGAARELAMPLISADRTLLAAGLTKRRLTSPRD
jgi:predicted nucleic acid-binding protein